MADVMRRSRFQYHRRIEHWKDCGSPHNAVMPDVMRRSRSQYHRALCFVKCNHNNVKKESMATVVPMFTSVVSTTTDERK